LLFDNSSMDDVELVPAETLPLDRLAELFTAAYEGYPLHVHVDEGTLAFMVDAYDLDLGRSRVASRSGEPVGLAMLAVREATGWIGGMGVVAAARRGGLGTILMRAVLDEARTAGLGEVGLEVLEPNDAAIRLYERLGFRRVRMLEVWSLAAAPPTASAREADPEAAHAWIRAHRRSGEPWQRADATLERLRGVEAVELPDAAAALVRVSDGRASVLQLAAHDVDAAADVLAATRARADTLSFLNVPEGDPASSALERLGGKLEIRQHEMSLALAG
jgi:ribosomal protein S18 acetylase RimI-like enzyme